MSAQDRDLPLKPRNLKRKLLAGLWLAILQPHSSPLVSLPEAASTCLYMPLFSPK